MTMLAVRMAPAKDIIVILLQIMLNVTLHYLITWRCTLTRKRKETVFHHAMSTSPSLLSMNLTRAVIQSSMVKMS